ncbi:MAG: hypothetical protein N3D11_08850 [Candidatus Sumerlaeia bacterium]|nr:hypothetical protein [Candidatus Sumerlaeia bacterium]
MGAQAWEFDHTQAQYVELRGQFGGACRAVARGRGNRVLAGLGPRLVSVEVTTPTQPIERESLLLPAIVTDIAVYGDVAAVLADGLWIVDAAAGGSFRETAYLPLTGEHLLTSGSLLFVLGRPPNIQVVSLRNPGQPFCAGSYFIPGESRDFLIATGMVFKDRYAYVSYIRQIMNPGFPTLGGFAILDMSDPKSPLFMGSYFLPKPALGIARDGNSLFLLLSGQIQMFDIRNPLVPLPVAEMPAGYAPRAMRVANGWLFVADNASTIWAYELRGELPPRDPVRTTTRGDLWGMEVSGNRLYAADGPAGLSVWDFSTTGMLAEIGRLPTLGAVNDIAVEDGRAFAADGWAGLISLDLSDPDSPRILGRAPTVGPAGDILTSATRAYVAEGPSGMETFDVSDPLRPRAISFWPTNGQVAGLARLGRYLFVANGPAGLAVLDVSDPANPRVVNELLEPLSAESVVVAGDRAFVSDQAGGSGLLELDISQPTSPTVIGRMRGEGAPVHLAVGANRVAIAEAGAGLRLADVSQRGRPVPLGRLPTTGWLQGVAMEGDTIHGADVNLGYRAASAADPYRPCVAGFLSLAGEARRVRLANGRLYLAAGEAGIYIAQYRGAPDLSVRLETYEPQDVVAGTEIRLTGTVAFHTPVPLPTSATLKVMVSESVGFTPPRQLLCQPVLLGNPCTTTAVLDLATLRFVTLAAVPRGKYTLGVVVDEENAIAERVESNNMDWALNRPLYVGRRPLAARRWENYR